MQIFVKKPTGVPKSIKRNDKFRFLMVQGFYGASAFQVEYVSSSNFHIRNKTYCDTYICQAPETIPKTHRQMMQQNLDGYSPRSSKLHPHFPVQLRIKNSRNPPNSS